MIVLKGAGVRYGPRWIFRNLDLSVGAGTCLALLGPNGRGKTTLIRAALGALKLNEGQREAPPLIGYVPQAGSPTVPYRTLDIVVMGRASRLGVFGSPRSADYRVARDALARVGMVDLAEQSYSLLSGGERQLVLLARALATGGTTLVLDEPASSLDLANQDRLLIILSGLRAEGTYAILFSTHLPQHALYIADEAMLMMGAIEIVHGVAESVMSESNLARLYGIAVRRVAIGTGFDEVETVVPVFGRGAGLAS